MRKFLALLFSLSLVFSAVSKASAQQNLASADLYPADISAFPVVTALLDVFDSQKFFASGLKPEAVSVIEDGAQLAVDSLTEMAIPLQLVVAVNQGTPLDARDANGISRFQRVAQVIAQWAQSRPADLPDDFSLVSQAGAVINHSSAADFVVGLGGFQPDFRTSIPNLQSLATAMDTVSAQTPQLGMKRAILFITPQMPEVDLAATLEPLIQRAIENRIRIFIWYVDANTTFATTSAATFNNLAIQTGGTMFQYSGEERFPDPEAYFSPLRRTYKITYTSRVKITGEHSVRAQVTLPSGSINSFDQKFSVDVQPPNPIPVTPSSQITRQAPAEDPFSESLLPVAQELEIIIEFPDGHQRALARTTLYVDDKIADENTVEPFNKFSWDLTAYVERGEHQLVVEAVDVLGLSKTSMPVPVTVTVIKPPSGPAAFLAQYRTQITFGAIIFAGLMLFLILLSGRLRIPSLRAAQDARRAESDPLTQSVGTIMEAPPPIVPAEKNKKKNLFSRKAVPAAKSKKEVKTVRDAAAAFFRINPDGQIALAAPIPVIEKEMIFGTDPVQCTQIMDDPSISSVHARLRQVDDGGFLLLDNSSIAGTWANYEPVPREGHRLRHGDMVHFGQLMYRFMLTVPPTASTPKITFAQNIEE
ncbi:MAG: FHA domain-containing protein [Anaerolineales bacterium]|nr:FHA domain-containing protein [Anaerolineales bacterium]